MFVVMCKSPKSPMFCRACFQSFVSDLRPSFSVLVSVQISIYSILLLRSWFYGLVDLLQSVKQFLLLPSLFFSLLPWLEDWICFIVLERIFSDSFWVQIIKKLPVWNVDFCLSFFFFVSKIAYYIFQLSK